MIYLLKYIPHAEDFTQQKPITKSYFKANKI